MVTQAAPVTATEGLLIFKDAIETFQSDLASLGCIRTEVRKDSSFVSNNSASFRFIPLRLREDKQTWQCPREEKGWNRHYCCLLKTTTEEKTTLKRLVRNILPCNVRKIKNKESRYNVYLSYLISKPIKIASFDFNDTLVNTTCSKHINNIILNINVLETLFHLRNKKKYSMVIFSNESNVSSGIYDHDHDHDHVKYNKLPNFFSKIESFKKSLFYFYTIFLSKEKKKNFSFFTTSQLCSTYEQNRIWEYRHRLLLRKMKNIKLRNSSLFKSLNYVKKQKKNNFFSYFFSIGKGETSEIDMYRKPNEGLCSLYICLEAIKHLIILNFYFKSSHNLINTQMYNNIENEQLITFFRLSIEIFQSKEVLNIAKHINNGYLFDLNKMAIKILDTYINILVKKTKLYIFVKEKYPNFIALINFFLHDQEDFSFQIEWEKLLDFVNDDIFLKHVTACLVYKNRIIKKLSSIFSSVLFNCRDSFYVGNNAGRHFDRSDVDLQVTPLCASIYNNCDMHLR
ncbi:phosphatase, putative [Plasmodium ovale curtisi]|uniref:Phosphatase, putative n=1 Tax=Plasmodium ovale curtisi TaxID=864141 RepID=A0A1A8WL23_PLAOA|nr:phosphatase, putative [Plasmodium ovale curtisi]